MPIAVAILSLLATVLPTILNLFASKSKETPIITALAPFVPTAMAAAQQILPGSGDGASRASAATALLAVLVQAGKVVSTGGQLHTMDEFEAALPVIGQLFTGIIDASKPATATVTAAAVAAPVAAPAPVTVPVTPTVVAP